jgi:hypothetical protein
VDVLEVGWGYVVWLRIGTGGELLCIRYRTFGVHKMLGNYRVAIRVVLRSIQCETERRERQGDRERREGESLTD